MDLFTLENRIISAAIKVNKILDRQILILKKKVKYLFLNFRRPETYVSVTKNTMEKH